MSTLKLKCEIDHEITEGSVANELIASIHVLIFKPISEQNKINCYLNKFQYGCMEKYSEWCNYATT